MRQVLHGCVTRRRQLVQQYKQLRESAKRSARLSGSGPRPRLSEIFRRPERSRTVLSTKEEAIIVAFCVMSVDS